MKKIQISPSILSADFSNLEKDIKKLETAGADMIHVDVMDGFGGQKFISDVLKKIKSLKNLKDKKKLNFDIEVDGGINFSNFKSVIDAGANVLVSGTTIFKENDGDIKKNIDFLKSI